MLDAAAYLVFESRYIILCIAISFLAGLYYPILAEVFSSKMRSKSKREDEILLLSKKPEKVRKFFKVYLHLMLKIFILYIRSQSI